MHLLLLFLVLDFPRANAFARPAAVTLFPLQALLGEKQAAEAAKYFREAASRARRRCNAQPRLGSEGNKGDARLALARNLRMEGVAVSASGDLAAAEMLLRGGLKEIRGLVDVTDSVGRAGVVGEESLMLSALGRVLGRQR